MKTKYIHKQVRIKINGHYIQCDVKIVDVIRTLNKIGCITYLCCQDNDNGKVWICFTLAGVRCFWNRVRQNWDKTKDDKLSNWMYDQEWQYLNFNEDNDKKVKELVSFRFPKKELGRFRRYLRSMEG